MIMPFVLDSQALKVLFVKLPIPLLTQNQETYTLSGTTIWAKIHALAGTKNREKPTLSSTTRRKLCQIKKNIEIPL